MRIWTRRDVVKSGLAASVGAFVTPELARGLSRTAPAATPAGRERLLLDFGWRFHLGHADDPAQDFDFGRGDVFAKVGRLFRPSRQDFDDHDWQPIDLPHDWAVALPFETPPSPPPPSPESLVAHGCKPLGRAYPATSIGWYRRVFELPADDLGRRLSIEFDGVFRDCIVALNGQFLGRNLSGYAPFRYDVTDVANYGRKNVLVVRVDATEHEGWFYEGAGIYRHVWLVKTDPVHVAHWGTFVTSEVHPGGAATITARTQLENESDRAGLCRVISTVVDAAGKEVATGRSQPVTLAPWTGHEFLQHLVVTKPALWSVETPHLYRLITTITFGGGGVPVDRYETPFGIRTIQFDADHGFLLNGRRVELKGTCNHQDHAGVGAALPDRLQSYRIERLKAMGSNAYRTAHNPPTPELLDACDRLGILVLDENRLFSSEPEGLSQLERLIRRDRNRPSVFAWSIANEEWSVQGDERGTRIAESVRRLAHRLDPSRPVTAAMDSSYGKGISLAVDVQGFNYQREDIDAFHRNFPRQPSLGTECASAYSTRGIYATDSERGYVSAYDVNRPSYGATAEQWWTFYAARAFLGGGFVWTGFDYRGEPSPYRWPCISSHFGIMDTCGFPKDTFYYYQAWWGGGDAPVLHLFPHWNWPGKEGQEIEVWCHSNLDRVELSLNGRSLGIQDVPRNSHVVWKVPYAPGTLEARGYKGAQVVLTAQRETTGAPARLVLSTDRSRIAADGEDVAVVTVQVVDTAGRLVPVADDAVTFQVTGNGRLIGVGNGDPSSHEADTGDARRVFNGLAVAIVQATKTPGEIQVRGAAPNLEAGVVVVGCDPVTPRPAVA